MPPGLATYMDFWEQDLKDFARQSSLDVVYSETGRDANGRGYVLLNPFCPPSPG